MMCVRTGLTLLTAQIKRGHKIAFSLGLQQDLINIALRKRVGPLFNDGVKNGIQSLSPRSSSSLSKLSSDQSMAISTKPVQLS